MNILEIWLLAIGLAMDCLAVSIASGIILKKVQWKPIITIALSFGSFQAIMPLIGWTGASYFIHLIENVDHWIAFGLLCFLGVNMIRESFCKKKEKHNYNLTKLRVILMLAVATSIDALAVGISFACLGMKELTSILLPIAIIGFVSFAFSLVGLLFGIYFGSRHNWKMEFWGGLILIGIGTKILIEHLVEHN